MKPASHDFYISSGDTLSFRLRFKDENGSYLDTTGFSAVMKVRRTPASPTIEAQCAGVVDNQISFPGGIYFELSASDTSDMDLIQVNSPSVSKATRFVYDVKVTDAGGKVSTPLAGSIEVTEAVSRA